MKYLLLPFCFVVLMVACKKDPIKPGTTSIDTTVVSPYPGTYDGLVNIHVAGVDSNGVYKSDTSYAYSVTVEYAGENKITIHGQTTLESIPVDDTGHFEFHDFNRNIEGDFKEDSLYIFSDAISGTYNFPQFYVNEQMSFAGEK